MYSKWVLFKSSIGCDADDKVREQSALHPERTSLLGHQGTLQRQLPYAWFIHSLPAIHPIPAKTSIAFLDAIYEHWRCQTDMHIKSVFFIALIHLEPSWWSDWRLFYGISDSVASYPTSAQDSSCSRPTSTPLSLARHLFCTNPVSSVRVVFAPDAS